MASNAGGASISTEQLKARYVGTGMYAPFDLFGMFELIDMASRKARNLAKMFIGENVIHF
jgi:hypothetical protein